MHALHARGMHAACMPACMIHSCSAGMHSLEGRAYIDIEDSKYYKICLGKITFWPWLLKTSEGSFKKCKIENFEGSSIWLKEA